MSIATHMLCRPTSTRECGDGQPTFYKVCPALQTANLVPLADKGTVLNRARPENEEKERKTASGRTFKVQG